MYTAKGEPRSPVSEQVFIKFNCQKSRRQLLNGIEDHRAIKKVVMKTLGERGYTAQETMHCVKNCEKLVLFL